MNIVVLSSTSAGHCMLRVSIADRCLVPENKIMHNALFTEMR